MKKRSQKKNRVKQKFALNKDQPRPIGFIENKKTSNWAVFSLGFALISAFSLIAWLYMPNLNSVEDISFKFFTLINIGYISLSFIISVTSMIIIMKQKLKGIYYSLTSVIVSFVILLVFYKMLLIK